MNTKFGHTCEETKRMTECADKKESCCPRLQHVRCESAHMRSRGPTYLEKSRRNDWGARRIRLVDTTRDKQHEANGDECNSRRLLPYLVDKRQSVALRKTGLTANFTLAKAQEEADDACNNQEKSDEIKIGCMFPQGATLMRVEIEEEEQQDASNNSGRASRE